MHLPGLWTVWKSILLYPNPYPVQAGLEPLRIIPPSPPHHKIKEQNYKILHTLGKMRNSIKCGGGCSVPKINPFGVGIDFRRQNLTSIDVRF